MSIGAFLTGFTGSYSDALQQERQRQREAEDQELRERALIVRTMIDKMGEDPANGPLLSRAWQDYMTAAGAIGKKRPMAKGKAGFMGKTETPELPFLNDIMAGKIPAFGQASLHFPHAPGAGGAGAPQGPPGLAAQTAAGAAGATPGGGAGFPPVPFPDGPSGLPAGPGAMVGGGPSQIQSAVAAPPLAPPQGASALPPGAAGPAAAGPPQGQPVAPLPPPPPMPPPQTAGGSGMLNAGRQLAQETQLDPNVIAATPVPSQMPPTPVAPAQAAAAAPPSGMGADLGSPDAGGIPPAPQAGGNPLGGVMDSYMGYMKQLFGSDPNAPVPETGSLMPTLDYTPGYMGLTPEGRAMQQGYQELMKKRMDREAIREAMLEAGANPMMVRMAMMGGMGGGAMGLGMMSRFIRPPVKVGERFNPETGQYEAVYANPWDPNTITATQPLASPEQKSTARFSPEELAAAQIWPEPGKTPRQILSEHASTPGASAQIQAAVAARKANEAAETKTASYTAETEAQRDRPFPTEVIEGNGMPQGTTPRDAEGIPLLQKEQYTTRKDVEVLSQRLPRVKELINKIFPDSEETFTSGLAASAALAKARLQHKTDLKELETYLTMMSGPMARVLGMESGRFSTQQQNQMREALAELQVSIFHGETKGEIMAGLRGVEKSIATVRSVFPTFEEQYRARHNNYYIGDTIDTPSGQYRIKHMEGPTVTAGELVGPPTKKP